jgi:hypothetical protein
LVWAGLGLGRREPPVDRPGLGFNQPGWVAMAARGRGPGTGREARKAVGAGCGQAAPSLALGQ